MKREFRVTIFVEEIWKWYSNHKRILPWRDLKIKDDTERAYRVLVSEIMLQQTQVPRVVITFKEFLRRFPTLKDLAQASNRDVLIAWRGMGYNSRALRLRDAAKRIGGEFPTSIDELQSIPGIGHYTAGAIRNFAFNIPTPCLDTNIRRILHRVFVGPENPDGSWEKDDGYLLKIAEEALELALKKGGTADWHAALMDFGSLVQTKRNPKWDICPLTAQGIMKATQKSFESRVSGFGKLATRNTQPATKTEPGRLVGSTFIPNRIFRGRIVEALRDAPDGLTLSELGKTICIDWSPAEHQEWLTSLLEKLKRDALLSMRKKQYVLAH